MSYHLRHIVVAILITISLSNMCQSQEWLTSLDAAKRLALIQDKMILMMWEDAIIDPFPVIIEDESGKSVVVDDLFEAPFLNRIIWEHFIPVSVSESMYPKLYDAIIGKRSNTYMEKFYDDSIKIMDVNGNILNIEPRYEEILNFTELISTYNLNISILKPDLVNYSEEQNFTTAFDLGAKYIDLAIYSNSSARSEILKLSNVYFEEAQSYLKAVAVADKVTLVQKLNLMTLLQQLVLDKPKKVLRQLNKIEHSEIHESNEPLVAFLYLTAHRALKDENNAREWRSKVSLGNLEKAKQIIDNNK